MNIGESVDKILASDDIIGKKFYNVFFAEFPDMKTFFEGIDMQRQAALLTTALVVVETYYTKPSVGLKPYLHFLGAQHKQRKIGPELYDQWTAAMLSTLEQFHGDDWSDSLKQEWCDAIIKAIEVMIEGY